MTRRFHGLAAALLGAATLTAAGPAQAAIQHLTAILDGLQEISPITGLPGAGDPDGTGIAHLWIDDSKSKVRWQFDVAGIALPLTGAHIHEAPAGQNGPIEVNFAGQLSGSGLGDSDLLRVIQNPGGFYVNLHNADFPGGAIRGQLSAVPEPAAVTLLAAALGLLGWLRRRA